MRKEFQATSDVKEIIKTLERRDDVDNVKRGVISEELKLLHTQNPVSVSLFLYKQLPVSDFKMQSYEILTNALDKCYFSNAHDDGLVDAIRQYLPKGNVLQKYIDAHDQVAAIRPSSLEVI